MKCAVVILNWNGSRYLKQFLPSVLKYSDLPNVQIVVADNGSTDDSLEVLNRFPTVKTILLKHNYGFAEGYNKALSTLDAEYFILLNSDVEVTPNWLSTLLNYMDTHTDVAACQPKIRSYNQRTHFEHAGACGGYIDKFGYPFCRGRIIGYIEKDEGQYDTETDIFWATGAALCIRADIYKTIGGLDGDFFAHMEEIDMCWRMRCRKMRITCVPQSVVYHIGGGTLTVENPNKTYLNFRNNLLLLYKNLPDNKLKRILAIRWLMDYAAALQLLVTGKPKNAKAVLEARGDFKKMKPKFWAKRIENMQHMTDAVPQGIINRCVVWDYYIKGMRK